MGFHQLCNNISVVLGTPATANFMIHFKGKKLYQPYNERTADIEANMPENIY